MRKSEYLNLEDLCQLELVSDVSGCFKAHIEYALLSIICDVYTYV